MVYALAPGFEVAAVSEERLVFHGNGQLTSVDGESAKRYGPALLHLADSAGSLDTLSAAYPQLDPKALGAFLENLTEQRLLSRRADGSSSAFARQGSAQALYAFLEQLGHQRDDCARRLGELRVAIAGLDAQGAHLAVSLAEIGVGTLRLSDPYALRRDDLIAGDVAPEDSCDTPRHDVLRAVLLARAPSLDVKCVGTDELTPADMDELVQDCDVVLACFDSAFPVVHEWINQAALAQGVPTIYSEMQAHEVIVGPLIMPNETGCYRCYRSSRLACERHFKEMFALEEQRLARRGPADIQRCVPPALPGFVAGLLGLELMKSVFLPMAQTLSGRILEFDPMTYRTRLHPFLEQPDCPVCKKKRRAPSPPN